MGKVKKLGKSITKPFKTGASSAQRQAKNQQQMQMWQAWEQQRKMEEQQRRNEEMMEQQRAEQQQLANQTKLQTQLANQQAVNAEDDSADVQIGQDLNTLGNRKRKRKPYTGSSALGL